MFAKLASPDRRCDNPGMVADPLVNALRRYRRAERAVQDARAGLHDAIRAEVTAGASKSAVGRIVGYTREYVAKICDEQG